MILIYQRKEKGGEPFLRGIEVFGNYEALPPTMMSFQPHPQGVVVAGEIERIQDN